MSQSRDVSETQVLKDLDISSVPKEFTERYKYVDWTREDMITIEELAVTGEVKKYIEQRREESLIALGKIPPREVSNFKKQFETSTIKPFSDAGDFLTDVGEIFNILNKTKIANAFSGLGLAINCADFFMSLLNPGKPDPTIELIKECFKQMMEKMEQISDQIADLEKLIEWQTVQLLLGPSEENIRNTLDKYLALQDQIGTSYEDAYYEDFINFADNVNLENCMKTLANAFTDKESAFGMRNLPQWAYEQTDHDYGVMQTLFTVLSRLMLPGMHMHLFVCKHKKLDIEYESEQWSLKIDAMTEACEEQLTKIFDTLPNLIDNDFSEYFRKRGFGKLDNTWGSYNIISRDTNSYLRAKYPFANFAVMAYTPMVGSHNHHIGYVTSANRTYLHQGDNKINVYVHFEKKKQTEDWFAWWISSGNNKEQLDADIERVRQHLNNNTEGNAQTIYGSCGGNATGQRNFMAFIVPDRKVYYCQGVHHSTLVKMAKHQIASTENGTNWNYAVQRYSGHGSW